MKAEQANIGDKQECHLCKCIMICGMTQAFGNFPAKKQWQNSDGKAHYKPNMGGCNIPQEQTGSQIQTFSSSTTTLVNHLTITTKDEQKVIDSIRMVELLWCPALEKAKEVYKCTTAQEPQTNKDVMILAQVFFKAMVESFNK